MNDYERKMLAATERINRSVLLLEITVVVVAVFAIGVLAIVMPL